jgi:hypothetical protein
MDMTHAMLQPAIVLVLWTLVMWAWLYATRIPAVVRLKIKMVPTGTKDDLNAALPPSVRWKADNYNHLLEQPTLFYAVVLILAIINAAAIDVMLAWAYVGLRVVHSFVQALANIIMLRFAVFMAASLVLVALAVRTAMAVF